jgi:hypothetical protein
MVMCAGPHQYASCTLSTHHQTHPHQKVAVRLPGVGEGLFIIQARGIVALQTGEGV